MTPIFGRTAYESYVGNGYIYIIWKESPVDQGCLSAFANPGADPFLLIDLFEKLGDMMQVVCLVFGSKILPVE